MKNKNKVVVSIVAIVIIAALLIGYFLLKDRNTASNGEGAYVEKVSVITGGGMIYADRYSGVVESQETLEIKKDSERPVEELYVEIGETVIIGSPLFKYDVTEAQNNIASTHLEIEGINNDIAALNAEISELVSDRNRASADEKLDYTTQIQSKQMQIRQDDIELQQKKQDLEKYQKEIDNAVVTSSISGVVKTISENGYDNFGNELPYISITQTGEYRVKGKVDENSIGVIVPGMDIIIRSRIDESATWTGSVSHIDTEPVTDNNNYYGGESGERSSSYPFYVTLDSAEGLMLGQHVYIEPDYGQGAVKEGIWLDGGYIVFEEDGSTYVWAANSRNRLEKRKVELGEMDEETFSYQIVSGLNENDMIAWPDETLHEGMSVITSDMFAEEAE